MVKTTEHTRHLQSATGAIHRQTADRFDHLFYLIPYLGDCYFLLLSADSEQDEKCKEKSIMVDSLSLLRLCIVRHAAWYWVTPNFSSKKKPCPQGRDSGPQLETEPEASASWRPPLILYSHTHSSLTHIQRGVLASMLSCLNSHTEVYLEICCWRWSRNS